MDAIEVHPVAAFVADIRAKADLTPLELRPDDLGNFANPVVLGILADVENLALHSTFGRNQRAVDRFADVLHVDEWSPGAAIADHGDAFRGPRERTEIVQHDVEAHARGRPIG